MPVSPGALCRQLACPRPPDKTAATPCPRHDPTVDGVRRPSANEAHHPDDDTDADADGDAAKVGESMIGSEASVDAEGDEGQQTGVLVGLSESVSQPTRGVTERPVGRVRRDAEER